MKRLLRGLRGRWRRYAATRRYQRFFARFIVRDMLCFDVGACRGLYTDAFLRLGARVVAVEPQPALAAWLERRFRNERRVVVIPKALGAAEGKANLYIAANEVHSSLHSEWIPNKQQYGPTELKEIREVDITTLDALIAQHGRPDFVKIDVEGAELQVLQGLHQPLPYLSIEYHYAQLDQTSACLDFLARFGAYQANYSVGNTLTWGLDAWASPDSVLRLLQEQSGKSTNLWGDVYLRWEA